MFIEARVYSMTSSVRSAMFQMMNNRPTNTFRSFRAAGISFGQRAIDIPSLRDSLRQESSSTRFDLRPSRLAQRRST